MKARLADGDGTAQLREIASLLLKGTGGNPLSMTSIVNHFGQRAARARTPAAIASIPDDVRRFIERQIDELGESDCNLLTAASVISSEFATAAIAAAPKTNVEQLEVACAKIQTSTPTDYKSLLSYFDLARQFKDHFSIKDCNPASSASGIP